ILFFGLLMSFLVGFILTGKYLSFSKESIAELSMVIGILGGLFFLFLWLWLRHPIILFLLNGFVFGFLISATIIYTPLGNIEIFINNKNFWSLLSLGTLCIAVFTIAVPFLMTAVGSSVVGCYIMLLFYDDFVGTRLSYIILNIIKRAVSRTRIFAANDFPFQTNDIIMSTIWVVLSLIAMIIWLRKRQTTVYGITKANSGYFTYSLARNRESLVYLPPEHDITHQPLLRENNAVFYQTFPQATIKRLNALKAITANSWGARTTHLLQIVNATIHSKLECGCHVFITSSKSEILTIEILYRTALRFATGLPKWTPIPILLKEAGQISLSLRIRMLAERFFLKNLSSVEISPLFHYLRPLTRRLRLKKPVPLSIRLSEQINKLGIDINFLIPSHPPLQRQEKIRFYLDTLPFQTKIY
ncbi:hypothetical protein AVEN_259105-1, partial [Araneus ventricosus]